MLEFGDEGTEEDLRDLRLYSMIRVEEAFPYEDDLDQEVGVSYKPVVLTGNEVLTATNIGIQGATVLHFWQWAFSDLRANNLRGIFAEWLVAKLLQLDQPVRDSWAACDLITPNGVTIEVKTSAYLQSWSDGRHSSISFSGLKGQTWTLKTGYSETATYNANLYVFCVQIEKDTNKWNVLDLTQWRFYVLPKEVLLRRNYKTITLNALASLAEEMTADQFSNKMPEMIKAIGNSSN